MIARTISQPMVLQHAKQIARDYGYFIVTIQERTKKGDLFNKYLLYHEVKPRNVLVGKRSSVDGIDKLVRDTTGFR